MSVSDDDSIDHLEGQRAQVNTKLIFAETFKTINDFEVINFSEFLDKCDEWATTEGTKISSIKITKQALGNSRGRWFEWLVALGFWKWALSTKMPRFTLAQLPNVTSFDSAQLFIPSIQREIHKFKENLMKSDVTMVTSNPDFVLIRKNPTDTPLFTDWEATEVTPELLESISNYYLNFVDTGNLTDVFGYLAVKSSMRPDRRLQIAHEGSTYKALSKNISKTIKIEEYIPYFFAISGKTTESDRYALKTVATHSIAENAKKPIRAVDQVFDVNNYQDLSSALDELQRMP